MSFKRVTLAKVSDDECACAQHANGLIDTCGCHKCVTCEYCLRPISEHVVLEDHMQRCPRKSRHDTR